MNNKILLITGGGRRVGKIIVTHFAKKNWNVAFTYFSSVKEAKELEKKFSNNVKGYRGNLKNLDFCNNLIKNVKNDFGNINLLINNASFFKSDSFLDTNLDLLEDYINIHLKIPFILCQQYAKLIKKGNIINITDYMVKYNTSKNYFSYILSKKMLQNLTEMIASSLKKDIKVNYLMPRKLIEDEEKDNNNIKLDDINKFLQQIDNFCPSF